MYLFITLLVLFSCVLKFKTSFQTGSRRFEEDVSSSFYKIYALSAGSWQLRPRNPGTYNSLLWIRLSTFCPIRIREKNSWIQNNLLELGSWANRHLGRIPIPIKLFLQLLKKCSHFSPPPSAINMWDFLFSLLPICRIISVQRYRIKIEKTFIFINDTGWFRT